MSASPTIHASAVLVGRGAVLIRGSSGSGKSRLVLRVLQTPHPAVRFARLVGDDRVRVEAVVDALLVRPAESLAGLLEVRGLGIFKFPHEAMARVSCVLDLDGAPSRLPEPEESVTTIAGVALPRLAPASGGDPMDILVAWLTLKNTVVDHGVRL